MTFSPSIIRTGHFKPAWLLSIAAGIMLCVACSRPAASEGKMPWETTDGRLDSLLDVADRMEMHSDTDPESMRSVLLRVNALSEESTRPEAKAAGVYASARITSLEDKMSETHRLDSVALGILGSSRETYLSARIKLHLAQHDSSLEEKTDLLFDILPSFIDARDSMRVVETLYELNKAYGRVWDNETQIEYLTEILNYVPDSIPVLKGVMHSNIIRLQRFRTDTDTYLRSLDSLRNEKQLMDLAPSFGVLVFSDLYRLRGNDADLDSAGEYFRKLEVRHNAARVYTIQRLKQAIKNRDLVAADTFARNVKATLSPDDRPIDMEAMGVLIAYYDLSGQPAVSDSVRQHLNTAVKSADAYERALTMARMNADRRIDEFRKYSEQSLSRRRLTTNLIVAGAILLTVGGVAALIVLRQRRRHRRQDSLLKQALEKAQRRLTMMQMHSAESDSDWERFNTVFTEMRPGFIDNLKNAYPNLTRGDIRLCCFLELNMETKHIAQLMMIRPESVKKHKKRLRDKFGITPETQWSEFFSQF